MNKILKYICSISIIALLIIIFAKIYTFGYPTSNNVPIHDKEVFLTFDDGPSINNTKKLLKILNDNNVKATFFTIGTNCEKYPSVLKDLDKSGMAICVHTYSHKYNEIYKNAQSYMNDYDSCKNSIRKIINKNPLSYVRMPGGSTNHFVSRSNLILIKKSLQEKGIQYLDWNVCSGDADSHEVPVEKIKRNVRKQCKDKKVAVILMHDTYYKHFTVEALPDVIKYLKSQDFVFRTFSDITKAEEKELINLKIMDKN